MGSILTTGAVLASQEPLALYLHIPFCGTRCSYCAFNTYTNAESLLPAYVAALCNELGWLGRTGPLLVHTLYFGGGTPSMLTPAQVDHILAACRRAFMLVPDVEITLEANPGTVDQHYLARLRETGVNRLSIGMQSAHPDELRLMARDHDADAVPRTVEAARRAGFANLSLDLIYGLPLQTLEQWIESVRAALALQPEHLSMYALELESGTALTRLVERGRLPRPDDDLAADMYEAADTLAEAAGLAQYEISNWARPGFECRHNLQYWRNAPYLGIGAGAHGYAARIRYEIVKPIRRYIELAAAQSGPLPFPLTASVARLETIDHSTAMAEHMFTGLRLVRTGVHIEAFRQRFGLSIDDVYGEVLRRLVEGGLLRREAGYLRLAPAARLLSNQVFLQFM